MVTELPPGRGTMEAQQTSIGVPTGNVTVQLQGVTATVSVGTPLPLRLADDAPVVTLAAGLLSLGASVEDGTLIEAVAIPWFEIIALLNADPDAVRLDPRQWEEIIAGAYTHAGFDEVILTPRSGDLGRDVIATRTGVCSVRVFDQVKAYKPGHLVSADEVRALYGVVAAAPNVTKGIVTTTSDFAPRLREDRILAPHIPHRLELKPRSVLLPWLNEIASKGRR